MDWGTALLLDMCITVLAYLLVPVIFCISKKELTKSQVLKTVIINGAVVWLLFTIIRIEMGIEGVSYSVVLWSSVAYGLLNKFCRKDVDDPKPIEEEPIDTTIIEDFPDYLNAPNYKPIIPDFREVPSENLTRIQTTTPRPTHICISNIDDPPSAFGTPANELAYEPPKNNEHTNINKEISNCQFEENHLQNKPQQNKPKDPSISKTIIIILSCFLLGSIIFNIGLCANNIKLNKEIDKQISINEYLEKADSLHEFMLEEKSDFIDEYVVFIEDNGSNLYHQYSCSEFTKESFWAYNIEAAKGMDYYPCPKCHD